jgi:hypothetical protein
MIQELKDVLDFMQNYKSTLDDDRRTAVDENDEEAYNYYNGETTGVETVESYINDRFGKEQV